MKGRMTATMPVKSSVPEREGKKAARRMGGREQPRRAVKRIHWGTCRH
jgi:hypothetical protein